MKYPAPIEVPDDLLEQEAEVLKQLLFEQEERARLGTGITIDERFLLDELDNVQREIDRFQRLAAAGNNTTGTTV
jgi:hypothetical protein